MSIPTLILPAQWETTKTTTLIEQVAELGDGYTQFMSVGINPVKIEWQVKSNMLTRSKVNSIVSQLETFSGFVTFGWSPDNGVNIPMAGYFCEEWNVTPYAPNAFMLEATFVKDGDSECLSLAANTNLDLMKIQLEGLINFFNTYTRSTMPMIANAQGVVVNAFQTNVSSSGYLPASTGTSEGQALVIAGILAARRSITTVTAQATALTLATLYGSAFIQYFYRESIPTTAKVWLPHELVNVKQPFVSKGPLQADTTTTSGFFTNTVSFTNGIGTIPTGGSYSGEKLSDVYIVYSTDGRLLWQNVKAPLAYGTQYAVTYWVSNPQLLGNKFRYYPNSSGIGGVTPLATFEPAGKIALNSTYTGIAYVIYSTLIGSVVNYNEPFESYPMWLSLATGVNGANGNKAFKSHSMAASDYAYNAFDELLQATGDSAWQSAKDATIYSTNLASQVVNESYLFKVDTTFANPYTRPFSYPGTIGFLDNNSAGGGAVRLNTGWVQVSINDGTELFPIATLQNFAVMLQLESNSTINASFGCSVNSIMEVYLSLSSTPLNYASTSAQTYTRKYTYYQPVVGGTDITISVLPSDFVKYNLDNWWQPRINQDNQITGSPIYFNNDTASTVTNTLGLSTIGINSRLVSTINMTKATGGYTTAGFVMLNISNNPPPIYYSKSGVAVKIKIVDSLGQAYFWTLPDTGSSWSTFNPKWVTADTNTNTLVGDGLIQSFEIVGSDVGTSAINVWWIGASPELLPASCVSFLGGVLSSVDIAHTFRVGDFKVINSPLSILNGSPGVTPSTVSLKQQSTGDYIVDKFRVLQAVTGYQNPNMWDNWNYPDRAQQVLTFLTDSQKAYSLQNVNNTVGPFSPVYIWPSWTVGVNGTPNKWSFTNMVDPSYFCSNYQMRPLVAAAKYWKSNPRDPRVNAIVMSFLGYLDRFCRTNNSPLLPTHYYEFADPVNYYVNIQDYALVARAALYANISGGDPAITYRVFKKAVDFLMSEYVSSGTMAGTFSKSQLPYVENGVTISETFAPQLAEIMITLSEIIRFKNFMSYPSCSINLN